MVCSSDKSTAANTNQTRLLVINGDACPYYGNEFVNFNNAFYNGNLYWPSKNITFHLKPHMKDQLIYPALKIIYETDENIKMRTEKKKPGSADATIFIDNEKPLEFLRKICIRKKLFCK